MKPYYEWQVILFNERMGFQKTFDVPARGITQAIGKAVDRLRDKGYDPDVFEIVGVKRGKSA